MRILQLHCDSIEYTPTKKEIKSAEEIEPKKIRIEEVVVCFIAVEKNDDSDIAKNSIAVKHTTTSSIRIFLGSISSADFISFFVGVYSILSQCNCKIRIISHRFNY